MSGLLTRAEYQSIASALEFPTNALINGKFMAAKSGQTFDTVNPADGSVIAQIASCDTDDVDLAVAKAREVFERGVWSKMHPSERKKTMIRLVKLLKRHRNELAVLERLKAASRSSIARLSICRKPCTAWNGMRKPPTSSMTRSRRPAMMRWG